MYLSKQKPRNCSCNGHKEYPAHHFSEGHNKHVGCRQDMEDVILTTSYHSLYPPFPPQYSPAAAPVPLPPVPLPLLFLFSSFSSNYFFLFVYFLLLFDCFSLFFLIALFYFYFLFFLFLFLLSLPPLSCYFSSFYSHSSSISASASSADIIHIEEEISEPTLT